MSLNNVHIFFGKIDYSISEKFYQNYYEKLPLSIRFKIDGYMKIEDRIRSVLGKYLLLHGLQRLGFSEVCLEQISFQENNRPYLKDLAQLDFNISHAASIVICVIGTNSLKVGIDIEKLTDLDLLTLKNQLSTTEWEEIESTPKPTELFYEFWVQKESMIKACNYYLPFNEIEIRFNRISIDKKTWYVQPIHIHKDYLCYLTSSELVETKVEEVTFDGTALISLNL